MKKLFTNKRGASVDNFYAMLSFFVFAIVVLILAFMWGRISTISALWDATPTGQATRSNVQGMFNTLDFFMFCLYIGSHLAVLGLAFLLKDHPIIYLVCLGLTVLLLIVSAPLSNVLVDIMTTGDLASTASTYNLTLFIAQHLPALEAVWAAITSVLLAAFGRYNYQQ